jgi:acyl transferase domain-containing protein
MSGISERIEQLTPLQRALYGLKEMRAKLDAIEQANTEPIAIIGMACRFPGGADTPESYWNLLHKGVNAVKEVPKDRWNIDAYYDPDIDAPGKMNTRWGGFLETPIDTFDAYFFGISPTELLTLDPQQRLLLEVAWEALENANLPPSKTAGSSTGVFIGMMSLDYGSRLLQSGNPDNIDAYFGTGNTVGLAAGRLSYVLKLTGPSFALDTACSSSLVALHLACQSLRRKECDMALTGGVSLMLAPEITISFSKANLMAADGRSKTFDASADGYVRGEGCGVVVLKRLSDALAHRDTILALVRGSAVNHDGPSGGLTVPSGPAQERVIRQALASGKVEPSQVDYVEAHGTGTSLGDPIEVGALGAVFGKDRSQEHPLIIGSVKTNMGHLEAAAGMASLLKVVLSLRNEGIPPHLHFNTPNPHIAWNEFPVKVPTEAIPWPSGDKARIAGISAFSFGGTNAHIVVEDFRMKVADTPSSFNRPLHLLTLSAKTDAALKQSAERYAKYMAEHTDVEIWDICFTANTGRSHFNHRLAVMAESSEQAKSGLSAFSAGERAPCVFTGNLTNKKPKLVFLFTGQGAQYVGMGRQLYETQPVFREIIARCDDYLSKTGLSPYKEKSLLEVLYPKGIESSKTSNSNPLAIRNLRIEDRGLLDETVYSQPALFAVEYALAELWKSWGIEPDAVLGHSLGEYIAACVAGVFSLEDGLKLIVERARLMQDLSPEGEMLTVFADETKVAEVIQPYSDVSIAAVNGPEIILISGAKDAIRAIEEDLKSKRIRTIKVNISRAFHSPLTEPMLDAFSETLKTIKLHPPQIALVSNVSAEFVTDEIATTAYWLRHTRQAVRFAETMKMLHEQKYELFVEIGPEPVLLGLDQCLPEGFGADMEASVQWLPSLSPKQSDWEQMLETYGMLYVHGIATDWSGFDRGYSRKKVSLPTYPFQRQRFWADTTPCSQAGAWEQDKAGAWEQEVASNLKSEKHDGQTSTQQPVPSTLQPVTCNLQPPADTLERIMSEQIRIMSQLLSQQLEVLKNNFFQGSKS